MTRGITLTDVDRLCALDEAERTFQMNEERFRAFYDQTARAVWAYLARVTGDARLADDLLQETYYRFLRARASFENDDHRRHYLFRIATNLARDHRRRARPERVSSGHDERQPAGARSDEAADRAATRIDVTRAMRRLEPRDRSLLWLAYVQGWSHREIAATLNVRAASLKVLLYRARRRLVALLREADTHGRRP